MILEESTLQCSVTKMDVVHLLFGQVHLKCYITENTFSISNTDIKMRAGSADLYCQVNCTVHQSNNLLWALYN